MLIYFEAYDRLCLESRLIPLDIRNHDVSGHSRWMNGKAYMDGWYPYPYWIT